LSCSTTLVAGSITANDPDCYVDIQVMSGQTGALNYACSGGGALASFGGNSFTGSYIDGNVDICFGTVFPWEDGCTWESAQTITGSLASGQLEFNYVEQPEPGQVGCYTPCTASGVITVQ
jgi:hypothetical protein